MVFDKIQLVYEFVSKIRFVSLCHFDPGIILDHFRHPKSIFRYLKIEILRFVYNFCFDLKIDFLTETSISRFNKTGSNLEKHGKKTLVNRPRAF